MKRRDFLGLAATSPLWLPHAVSGQQPSHEAHCATYASPTDAMKSPRETVAYTVGVYAGTPVKKPDYLAVVDVDPNSPTYSQVVHRVEMPNVGDELHHYGWNACGSCHGMRDRQYLVLPGLVSSRIHILDMADPREPRMHKVLEPEEILRKTKLTAPHTVHCLADGRIMISMLGDENLEGPGGFLLLDEAFEVAGVWEASREGMNYNYDFWYQPRHNQMVSSEWAAPRTTRPGFDLEDVKAGRYGRHVHLWDWTARKIIKSLDLGDQGLIPLEVRYHHDPDSTHGFVGAALSSVMWHFQGTGADWNARPVIAVSPAEVPGWPFPVPGLITDLVLSLDDRWLYFSNWLHGDVRQYDVSNPAQPRLAGQVWLGGILGRHRQIGRHDLPGGPQMLQLSLDGRRLYVTSSLFSSWDNQFYPQIAEQGSYMLQLDCDVDQGGLSLNERFHVDFGKEPHGPARAHEVRFPGGDCTSDIWI